MNKKILYIILLSLILLPTAFALADAATLPSMACRIQKTAIDVGTTIVIIGWIIAGILYLTAAGAPEKMETAKKAMIACVIGTLLIVLAIGSGAIFGVIRDAFGLPGGSSGVCS